MTLTLIAIGAFVATLLGGLFAIKFKDKLHLILGFSAGAIIGVAFFDLLPEALEMSANFFDSQTVMLALAGGFIGYMLFDRIFLLHCNEEGHSHKGNFGAGSLSLHSFLDGVAIGLAFQVSPTVGAIVAVAVLAHDFSDGVNTVSMILRNKGEKKQALRWLVIDALAPVAGILSTLFFTIPEQAFGIILAVFCGFFLYIGASDLLPESHHSHKTRFTTLATIAGIVVIYGAIRLAGV